MPGLVSNDRKAILALHHQWVNAERSGRGLDVLALCTPDVTWMVPGGEFIVGQEAARSFVQTEAIEILDVKTRDIRITGGGRLAVKTSEYRTRYRNVYTGVEQVSEGRHAWALRKEDGRWLVTCVAWRLE